MELNNRSEQGVRGQLYCVLMNGRNTQLAYTSKIDVRRGIVCSFTTQALDNKLEINQQFLQNPLKIDQK